MGKDFEDKWTTPKHIKIEREGEPRGLRRGPTKKKHRRKGKKARMDEIISAQKRVKQYYDWMIEERTRQTGWGDRDLYKKWHAEAVRKLRNLLKLALRDDIITEKGARYVQEGICDL